MAKAVMESFPQIPEMTFGTSKKEMRKERRNLALEVLEASGTVYVYTIYTVDIDMIDRWLGRRFLMSKDLNSNETL